MMPQLNSKRQLIEDIACLLNSYSDIGRTQIDPALLDFMDEEMLKSIISDLLTQKEQVNKENCEWLEQFKTLKNY